jgi:small subunit ribosomal protein S17
MSTHDRHNRRKILIGFVSSKMGDKSVKVTVPYKTPHPLYHKVINRKTVVHVHDEKNETKVGDKIEVMETRPISRLKRWRVVRVVEASIGLESVTVSENDVAQAVPTKTIRLNQA